MQKRRTAIDYSAHQTQLCFPLAAVAVVIVLYFPPLAAASYVDAVCPLGSVDPIQPTQAFPGNESDNTIFNLEIFLTQRPGTPVMIPKPYFCQWDPLHWQLANRNKSQEANVIERSSSCTTMDAKWNIRLLFPKNTKVQCTVVFRCDKSKSKLLKEFVTVKSEIAIGSDLDSLVMRIEEEYTLEALRYLLKRFGLRKLQVCLYIPTETETLSDSESSIVGVAMECWGYAIAAVYLVVFSWVISSSIYDVVKNYRRRGQERNGASQLLPSVPQREIHLLRLFCNPSPIAWISANRWFQRYSANRHESTSHV